MFSRHKQQLTDRRHRLKDRLRLFDVVVTSSLIYGCETWSLRVDQERRLKVTQRKMLRMVLNAKRRSTPPPSESESKSEAESEQGDEPDALEPLQEFLKRVVNE